MRLDLVLTWLAGMLDRACDADGEGDFDGERGDVPGWVMVTVMSAILVVAIIGVFEPQIKDAIGSAIDSVTNSK